MTTTGKAPDQVQEQAQQLCPFWARFFMRGDGAWIAFCSELACLDLDKERPNWRLYAEMPRSEHCLLGYAPSDARYLPEIVIGNGNQERMNHAVSQHFAEAGLSINMDFDPKMDDTTWSRYVDAFLDCPVQDD